MLEAIIQNGSQAQRVAAQETIHMSESIRAARIIQMPTAAPSDSVAEAGGPHKNRKIYTASNSTNLPGNLVRSEGQNASGDVVVNEAYDGLGATFDLFWNIYQRDSIDNAGMALLATVHYGNHYNNAFWDGSRMVFGDGDGTLFNRFTIAIDVIGHELTHGVTGATAKLVYSYQSGALNESISDVFGSLVKQKSLGQTAAQADWLIGAGLFAAGVQGVALRSMKAPGTAYNDPVLGKDPQPAHMSNFVNTSSDNGGVHINSGIPNKAFYNAAVALGGNAWTTAGTIWYKTLLDSRLSTTAQFQDFANLTVDNANKLYGSTVSNTIIQAWQQVGITVAPILSWQNNKSVLSSYASPHSMNAWAYIQDVGWRKIQPLTTDGVTNTFEQLVYAQAFNKKVRVYVDGSLIYQAYCV
jgi:Zn-dependent metalloprotease